MKCLLSIIIPAYNSERTIVRCLDSIKSQLTDDVEVIVVNDGSTDSTLSVCNGYASAESRFKVLHQENGGVSSARNHGLSCAEGAWVTFVDSDDELAVGALERILCATGADKDLVIENVIMYDVTGDSFPVLPTDLDSLEDIFYRPLCGSVCNKVFRRDIIEICGLRFDTSLSYCEDWLFTGRYLTYVKEFEYISEPCYIEYLVLSYAEKYKQRRGFQNMLHFYGKLKVANESMSRIWVDALVMSALSETESHREMEEKTLSLNEVVGSDIRYVKGRRKLGIRLLAYTESIVIWRIVFGLYYRLRCF